MKGRGTGASAVTFLNALFTGTGSAAGIELYAHAEVELLPGPRPEGDHVVRPLPLVDETARAALRAWSPEPWTARISIRSEIPPSCGLKSSSAVASAVEHAVLDALGQSRPPAEVARLGAQVALEGGFSATGAFDDALASVLPGLHVTDNLRMAAVRTTPVPEGVELVLWIPPRTHRASPEFRDQFRARHDDAGPALQAARSGDWRRSMGLNSQLVEAVMGYDYAALRRAVGDAGAFASGTSGMGPAFAAVTDPPHLGRVLRALPAGSGQIIVTRFLRRATGGGQ